MSFQVNLKKTQKPADYDGAEPNVQSKKDATDNADLYNNAFKSLKKTAKPEDYDGAAANVSVKKTDEAKAAYDVKLKKVSQ